MFSFHCELTCSSCSVCDGVCGGVCDGETWSMRVKDTWRLEKTLSIARQNIIYKKTFTKYFIGIAFEVLGYTYTNTHRIRYKLSINLNFLT